MDSAPAPLEPSLVGAVLSRRYLLTSEIGRGGMGAVYAAKQVEGGDPVAVKILHNYFVGDEAVMIRFLEEGRTCMRLVHPNILRVHECLVAEDGSPYLVMDLLEGIPLSAYTKDGGRVAIGHAIPVLRGILDGLEAAHASGVVHRDLKPGNVFLARDGAVFNVKLLDFGIAKVMDAAGGMGTKTRTGALLGTPAYMSPEQIKSAKDVDGRSDLWSVGVMFYEMLSGRVAFAAPTEYARLAAVISAQPPPIESIDPDLAPVGAFLQRALEKNRDRRFQTAREMSEALTKITPASGVSSEITSRARSAFSNTGDDRTVARSGRGEEPSAWSLVTDRTSPISDAERTAVTPPPITPTKAVLTAPVLTNAQSSTLASPNRSASVPPPPPPEVVVVPDEEIAAARKRTASAITDRKTMPPMNQLRRGIALPLVALLVTVALAFGFTLGVLFGRSH